MLNKLTKYTCFKIPLFQRLSLFTVKEIEEKKEEIDKKNPRLKIVGEQVNGRPQVLTTNFVRSWLRVEMTVLFSDSFRILHQI